MTKHGLFPASRSNHLLDCWIGGNDLDRIGRSASLARRPRYRQARDCGALSPLGPPTVLDLAVAPTTGDTAAALPAAGAAPCFTTS
jgi:hypothetical protein